MNEGLKKVFKLSTFEVISGKFVYLKVAKAPSLNDHFLVTKDNDEITVVTEENNLSGLEVIERNQDLWALICLNVSNPFNSVGFLAEVCRAVSSENENILVISTYSKDYILVRHKFLESAKAVLLSLGLKLAEG